MKDCVDKIFSINAGHDASVTYLVDGNIQWMIEEERYSHRKHDEKPYLTITKSSDIDPTSVVLLTMLHHPDIPEKSKEVEDTCNVLTCKTLKRSEVKYKNCSDQHHLHHAAIGFYNSGFEDAVCLIVDGAGAFIDDCGHEVETILKLLIHVPLKNYIKDQFLGQLKLILIPLRILRLGLVWSTLV